MQENRLVESNEISLKDLIAILSKWCSILLSKWILIGVFSCIGGVVGFFYSKSQPIKYFAKTTFILEEGKAGSSGLGGLASLAGQFGVDMGGDLGSGILSGENILLYFKSPSLSREVLLTFYDTVANETIADRYAKVYKLSEIWEKSKLSGKVNFNQIDRLRKASRIEDSLLQTISNKILSSQFSVSRSEKKASFIDVVVTMTDENLAKIYCERIVSTVVERYVKVKVQRQTNSVNKLQARADSLSSLLRLKTYSSTNLQNTTSTMDINPLYKTETNVAFETSTREKSLLASIFNTVIQNLEMAKFNLNQETPVIQIIDAPILPLKFEKLSKVKTTLYFAFGFCFLMSLFLILRESYFK